MLFNSVIFLFAFLPATVALYWIWVRRSIPATLTALAVLSYFFYVYGETAYPWMLGVSVVFNYTCGLGIRNGNGRWPRIILAVGICGDLLLLGVIKYANFFLEQLSMFARIPAHISLVLALGISFYSFTQIAYLVDTYREKDSEASFLRYFLFISYFPHLIAGPILHHKEMMPQFIRPRRRSPAVSIFAGLCLFAIGLGKKVLLADPCGAMATDIFGPAEHAIRMGWFDSWAGALSYTGQIYFDFSGYSDMALGISLMLGIRLPLNFNSPYKSLDLIDFWRRWHISLSRFLRDYLYFSLGGNRKGSIRRHVNLLLTMIIGGLWHGAGWTFIFWGALHGAGLLLNHLWRDQVKAGRAFIIKPWLGWGITFVFVVFAWVPFRAGNMGTVRNLWAGMLGLHGFSLPDLTLIRTLASRLHFPVQTAFFGLHQSAILFAALAIAIIAPNSQQIMRRFHVGLDSPGYQAMPYGPSAGYVARLDLTTAFFAALLLALSARCVGGYSEFIYFHF